MTNGINFIRFKAWLTVGGTPDGKVKGTNFPITSMSIAAGINTIPSASVTVASGFNMATAKASPVHSALGKLLRNPIDWPWATITMWNLDTNQSAVIFEGYIPNSGQAYAFQGVELTVSIVHWAIAMDQHPILNSILHVGSDVSYTRYLFGKVIDAGLSIDERGAAAQSALTIENMAAGLFPDWTTFREDMYKNGIKRALSILLKFSSTFTFSNIPEIRDLFNKDDRLSLTLEDILENRMPTNDVVGINNDIKYGQFPIPKIVDAVGIDNLAAEIYAELVQTKGEESQINSMWWTLTNKLGQFGLLVIPRCHEIRVIPKWFAGFVGTPYKLVGAISSANNFTLSRPIGAAIMMPSSLYGEAIGSRDPNVTFNYDDSMTTSSYGIKVSPDRRGGLLVRQRTGWGAKVINVKECIDTGLQTANRPQGTPDQDSSLEWRGRLAGDVKKDSKYFYDRLAEEALYDELLKGNTAEVSCPINFDVCPGSVVRFRTGMERRLLINDKLSAEYEGVVIQTQTVFDTINATAMTQYQIGHLRPREKVNDLPKTNPYYDCPPFIAANWCDFKIGAPREDVDKVSFKNSYNVLDNS